ncbi:MAG: hypothetical protein J3K34DRAFT_82272 [Monoraphidium minutum]|nr:MAG: hypothetical protein J3K34DRAFT_82272 [Monoraphidium minutum]
MAGSSSSSGGSSSSGKGAAPWPPSAPALGRLIKLNAFGDAYEDLAAAAARGAGARSVVGLWPAFAYFNHSCIPAAVHYAVGDRLVVRAVQDMAAGDEVTVSYLGREEFAPAQARQAVLLERWGFECGCERCTVEAAAPKELVSTIAACYARVMQDLRPAFLEAAADGDGGRLAVAADHLRGVEATARAAIKEHAGPGVHPATATFMHAALYDLHELLYAATQLSEGLGGGGESDSERGHAALSALSRCLAIVDAVSRGAELHVFLAAAMLERASALRGADSPQAAAALQLLGHASEARYGKQLSMGLWDRLQKANTELSAEYL